MSFGRMFLLFLLFLRRIPPISDHHSAFDLLHYHLLLLPPAESVNKFCREGYPERSRTDLRNFANILTFWPFPSHFYLISILIGIVIGISILPPGEQTAKAMREILGWLQGTFFAILSLGLNLSMPLNKLKKILLLVGDVLVLYASLYLTLLLRYQLFPSQRVWNLHFEPFTWLFGFWLIVFYINGLYDITASKNDVAFYNKLLRNILINYALAAAYFYILTDKLFDIKPQTVFFIFMGMSLATLSLWRFWYNSLVQSPNLSRNILVIGMKDEVKELVTEIIHKPQLGYRIAAIIHNGYRDHEDFPGVAILDGSVDIKKILRDYNISTVLSALDPRSNPTLVKHLYESLALKLQFFDLPTFYEKLTGKIPVTTIGHIWFLENLAESEKTLYETAKRLFDIVFSSVVLVLSLPFVPLIAILVKLGSSGPVFFRQVRVGLLGKPFEAIKFRSMILGAEKEGEPQWARKNDIRVTKIGKLLRKARIDEIPQLLNVLKGEMSLIGPRPERPEFVAKLQELIPFYNERHLIKPGLTGWAQINFQYGSSTGDALKKLQYDLFYIKNRSLPLDVGVLLKTINIILSGRGQ